MFFVYILHSKSIAKYYTGQTNNLDNRLLEHNTGQSKYTSRGSPWLIVYSQVVNTRSEAVILETKIKKRGAKRFINDLN